jgi:hypothetical protein
MQNLKTASFVYGGFVAVIILAFVIIVSGEKFPVTHYPKVEQTVSKDGRYVAGSDEYYQVHISSSLAWKLGKWKGWRAVGVLFILGTGAFIFLGATQRIELSKATWNYVCFVMLLIALASLFGSYSSDYSNKYIELSKEKYEDVKTDPEKLEQLFRNK